MKRFIPFLIILPLIIGCGKSGLKFDEVYEIIDEVQSRVDDVMDRVDSVQVILEPLPEQLNGLQTGMTDVRMTQASYKENPKSVLPAVYFGFDSFGLLNETKKQLIYNLEVLNANPKCHIIICGHTDSIGSDEYNMKLGESRASTVYQFLADHGISKTRMKTRSYGEKRLISDIHHLNRRVEFVIQ